MKYTNILKTNLMRATMTLALIVTCATAWATDVQTYYIDENGTRHDVTATVLTGTGNFTSNPNQWYVVNSDVTISNSDGNISRYNGINLILADGKTFSISSSNTDGIICSNGTLNIYGQENGTGTLSVTATGSSGNAIYAQSGVNIVGCNVTATSSGANGIFSNNNITISGGQVSATGSSSKDGLKAYGTLTLGWRKTTDHVYASSYYGTVKVDDGQAFTDGTTTYSGTLNSSQISAIAGKTLTPDISLDFAHEGNTYTIRTATGWGYFCDSLDNKPKNYFSGKTVYLANDIEVSRMAGSAYHDFTGTFNGQGNTLTFTYNATEAYAAPFRYVEGPSATNHAAIQNLNVNSTVTGTNCRHLSGLIGLSGSNVDVSNCNVEVNITSTKSSDNELYPSGLMSQCTGPVTISGCTVTGEIATNGKYAAGILGIVQGSATIATITNCVSSVTINSSTAGDGTHGGFVAVSYPGSTTIEGCLFNGKLLTVNTGETATGNCGGFVGWRTTGTVTISNSLYAPADLDDGETEVVTGTGDYPSATFVRNGSAGTNCYYTRALGTAQGKQRHSITAGSNVTINAIALTGNTTNYNVSGITAYSNGGLSLGSTLYYGNEDQVNLTLSNTPPTGYTFNGYAASNGGTITGTNNPYTLTMPNEDVTINAIFSQIPVTYLDEYGDEDECGSYTLLTSSMTHLGTADTETWYVADGTISFTDAIETDGNVHLILKDGAVVTVNVLETNAPDVAIESGTLKIYGQSSGANKGQLNAYASEMGIVGYSLNIYGGQVTANGGSDGIHVFDNLTINGGCVTATGNYNGINAVDGNVIINGGQVTATGYDCGIEAFQGSVTINGGQVTATGSNLGIEAFHGSVIINGGQVTATGESTGIRAQYNITLGWTNNTDYIHSSSYYCYSNTGTVSIASGKTFIDEDSNTYSGTIEQENGAYSIDGKTLYPEGVILKHITGYGNDENPGGYYLIASPVVEPITPSATNGFITDEFGNNIPDEQEGTYDLYYFDQTGGGTNGDGMEWRNYRANNFNIVNGTGYLYASKYGTTLIFTGVPYSGEGDVTLTKTEGEGIDFPSWNLVGNPFAETAYILDCRSFYTMNGEGSEIIAATDNSIAPMEGVFVIATEYGDVMTFTTTEPQYGDGKGLVLNLSRNRGSVIDRAIVRFGGSGTLPKFQLDPNHTKVYIPQDGKDYAVVYSEENVGELPVSFKAEKNGTYTLSINTENVEFSYLHLIDNLTGADVDLLSGASSGSATYTFEAKTTDYASRFRLVFATEGANDDNETFAFYTNGSWIISNEGEATLQVIDLTGRILSSETVNGSVSKSINQPAGVYMIRLINGETVRTQKVVVK